jgi:glycosyltransferase involved in cell wall biosynthesis
MVTADRQQLAKRAITSFRAQIYENKRLLIYDTSEKYKALVDVSSGNETLQSISMQVNAARNGRTIGMLRNAANAYALSTEIICHWDDDDWSSPNRIAEQVALLQSSGASVVGYNRMLFWREPLFDGTPKENLWSGTLQRGEAWIYTGEILGTSLCYWRKTWEQTPFRAHGHQNEDFGFVMDVRSRGGKVVAVDSIGCGCDPRMIARIHSGNAGNPAYGTLESHPHHWQRAADFDRFCKETM